jgi:putative ABC transport system permease protein
LGLMGEAEWEVVGTYRVVYGGGFVTEAIYAPLETVANATRQVNRATQVYIRTDGDPAATAVTLRDLYEGEQMPVDLFTTAVKQAEREEIDNQFYPVVSMLLSLAGLMAMVGGIGLMGSLGISVVERTREIGVMRAIGARSPSIMGLFVMEGVLQGVLSWLIAIPIAYVVSQPLARLLGQTMIEIELDYAFNGTAVLIWLLVILLISLLASILPARQATRISVRESLTYG